MGLSPKSFKTKKCGRKIKNQVWKKQNNISKGQGRLDPIFIGAAEAEIAIDMSHVYRPGVVLGHPILRRLGAQLLGDIEFHDMTMVFADHEEVLYDDTCCHSNERGYAIFVDAICSIILDTQIGEDGEQTPVPYR